MERSSSSILLGWEAVIPPALLRLGSFCQDLELATNFPARPSVFFYKHSQSIAVSHHVIFFCCLSKHSMSTKKMCPASEGNYHAEYLSSACPHPAEPSHVQPTTVTCQHQCYSTDTRLVFQHRPPHAAKTKSWDPSTERGKFSSIIWRNKLSQFWHHVFSTTKLHWVMCHRSNWLLFWIRDSWPQWPSSSSSKHPQNKSNRKWQRGTSEKISTSASKSCPKRRGRVWDEWKKTCICIKPELIPLTQKESTLQSYSGWEKEKSHSNKLGNFDKYPKWTYHVFALKATFLFIC